MFITADTIPFMLGKFLPDSNKLRIDSIWINSTI